MMPVHLVLHHPSGFSEHSAFKPLVELLDVPSLYYEITWEKLQARSWTLGHLLRRIGNRYYGSEWNALVPVWDELRFAHAVGCQSPHIVHFLWGEFASPRWPGLLRRRGAAIVGTFHCSARRQPGVLGAFKCFDSFDAVTVVSETQIPYFESQGVSRDRIRVIHLGVDTDYFRPVAERDPAAGGPLKALFVGTTERDHEFMVKVLKALPSGLVEFSVCTSSDMRYHYAGLAGVRPMKYLADDELLKAYQGADLYVMPFLDCTANDALLEAMACGTPVLTNRVGGIPEYVSSKCSFVMDGKNVEEWASLLVELARDRRKLEAFRAPVRAWADRFSWRIIVEQYRSLYRDLLGGARA